MTRGSLFQPAACSGKGAAQVTNGDFTASAGVATPLSSEARTQNRSWKLASLNVVSNGHHGVYCGFTSMQTRDVWFETYNPSTNILGKDGERFSGRWVSKNRDCGVHIPPEGEQSFLDCCGTSFSGAEEYTKVLLRRPRKVSLRKQSNACFHRPALKSAVSDASKAASGATRTPIACTCGTRKLRREGCLKKTCVQSGTAARATSRICAMKHF